MSPFSGTTPLGFKARVGSALFELSGGVRVMLHVPWDSPLVLHLPTSWWPAWQPSHLFHIPARHWWDSKPGAIMPPITVWDQTLYRLSYPGSAAKEVLFLRKSKTESVLTNLKTFDLIIIKNRMLWLWIDKGSKSLEMGCSILTYTILLYPTRATLPHSCSTC